MINVYPGRCPAKIKIHITCLRINDVSLVKRFTIIFLIKTLVIQKKEFLN